MVCSTKSTFEWCQSNSLHIIDWPALRLYLGAHKNIWETPERNAYTSEKQFNFTSELKQAILFQ